MHRAAEPDDSYRRAVLHDLRDLQTVVDRRLQGALALDQPELHAHLLALRRHVLELIENAVETEAP